MKKMQSLEAEVNATERYFRSYNARFPGVAEETGEQCASVVNDLSRNKLGGRPSYRERAPSYQ